MAGTRVTDLKLTKVVDGDTVKVELNDTEESLRLICLDTEESYAGGTKPVTKAGKLASAWAREFFGVNDDGFPETDIRVDVEFDTGDPLTEALRKHRGKYGRLICYVYKGDINYNVHAVASGWSPYFVKYGRSRLYHNELMQAEAAAQSTNLPIWDPATNEGGPARDYEQLVPWWHLRDNVVEDYRRFGIQRGALSVRVDYDAIVSAAENGDTITVLCDLQSGINRWLSNGALVYAGSLNHKFNLWIPDFDSAPAQRIINLIQIRYGGYGRSYVYVSGKAELYNGKPEIVLTDITQLSDAPPGA